MNNKKRKNKVNKEKSLNEIKINQKTLNETKINENTLDKNTTNEKKEKINYPLVSLCTPTFNRRPFIPYLIRSINLQDYPKDKIEWIIVDDGTDPIGDLFVSNGNRNNIIEINKDIKIKYFYVKEKMNLGEKRNYMHSKCSGSIIIYIDDDDYYPPQRISHAVEMLESTDEFLIAGSSIMHIYYGNENKDHDKIYQCGPYAENHATAATFAFKKKLLNITSYNENALFAEEKHFLKNYSIPLLQLNSLKTILVFSHIHNTINKEKLLENPEITKMSLTNYKISDFISDIILQDFYKYGLNNKLKYYNLGSPENKPKLLEQVKKVEEERNDRINNYKLELLKNDYEKIINEKNNLINCLIKRLKELTN